MLVSLMAYTFLFVFLGYLISTFLFTLFLLSTVSSYRWVFVLATSVLTAVASYLLFVVLLKTQLPKGLFGDLAMEFFDSALAGFQLALQPVNFLFCFLGVLIGTLVGVLPGLGPVAAMSLLLPTTFHVSPVSAIMLAGIYYGAMYGGSTTSILVNIPGEAASVVTCLDGYQMARQGRAGPALGIAAFASFIAGTLSIVGLMLIAPPLPRWP